MKHIFLRPLDTQFFRDGRPFQAGVETEATSIFPPFPRTIYGALRSLILTQYPQSTWWTDPRLTEVTGKPDLFGSLNISGPLIAAGPPGEVQTLFPVPFDLLKVKGEKRYIFISPSEEHGNLHKCSNLNIPSLYPCLPGEPLFLEESQGFLPKDYLEQYLTGSDVGNEIQEADDLFLREHRLGIGLNRATRTARQKHLYTASHIRMQDSQWLQSGLVAGFDGDNGLIPNSGVIRLGGDSRPVAYDDKMKAIDWNREINVVKKKLMEKGRFKTYLISPAIYVKNGWYPDFLQIDEAGILGPLPGLNFNVKLVGACVGKTIYVGGFDMKNRHPKEILKAVPAGSVYFFEFIGWSNSSEEQKREHVNQLLSGFFYKALADRTDTQGPWKEGFGYALIGGW